MATLQDPADTGGHLIAASAVNGAAVYNPDGQKLGSIYDLMLNKVSGHAEYAILSFGGFLGFGDQYHPLPWNALKYDALLGGYVVNLSREQLERSPSYATDERGVWDNDVWPERVLAITSLWFSSAHSPASGSISGYGGRGGSWASHSGSWGGRSTRRPPGPRAHGQGSSHRSRK